MILISQVGVSWVIVPRPLVSQYLWCGIHLRDCFLAASLGRDLRSRGRSGKARILWSHVPQNSSAGFPSPLPTLSVKVVQISKSSEPDDIGMIYWGGEMTNRLANISLWPWPLRQLEKSLGSERGYEACTAQTSRAPAYSIYVCTEIRTEHTYIEGRSRFLKIY